MVNWTPTIDALRRMFSAADNNDPAGLMREAGPLMRVMGDAYATPIHQRESGDRVPDRGAGDAYLAAKGAREAIARMPTHVGLGGVVWDQTWCVGLLDYLMRLAER